MTDMPVTDKGGIARMLQRIPLTPKMILLTIMVGIIAWGLLDYFQTQRLKSIFLAQLTERLGQQSLEDRLRFDHYIKAHNQSVKLVVSQKSFNDYIEEAEKKDWLSDDVIQIKYYKRSPSWLPEPSVLRLLAQPRYAFLLDARKRVREVYHGWSEQPPPSLLHPTDHLHRLTHKQGFMTEIDGSLYLVTMESLMDSQGKLRALLMFASPIDDEFLIASQGSSTQKRIDVLLTGGNPRILVSSRPDLLPAGIMLDTLQDRYLITGKAYFDYGSAEQFIGFASLISTEEVESLSKTILSTERQQRAISAFVLILSFSLIMFWITRHIHGLTQRIADFSQQTLGVQPQEIQKGDEIHILEERFHRLTREVELSRESMEQYAESLRAERDRAQNYLDIAGAMIIALDVNGEVTLVNRKGSSVLGYKEEDIIGKDWFDNFLPEGIREETRTVFRNIISNNSRLFEYYENKIITKSGEERIIAWHNSILRNKEGNVTGTLSSGNDITERRRAEEELKAFAEKLQQSNQDLHDFAYIASHDLQEPLRKVAAFGDRLKAKCNEALGKQGKDYLERMQNATKRMQTLINDLLMFSRVTTKVQPFVPVDLTTVVGEVLSDLEMRIEQVEGRVEVGDLPVIDADPLQMRQLLQNLIGNALKFHRKEEPPVVKIQCLIINPPSPPHPPLSKGGRRGGEGGMGGFSGGNTTDNRFCQISVQDNGIGFDEKHADRIFGVFQRLHGRSEYEGTGVGLSVCRKIVERHGGDITAKSIPGQGTTFIVTLPVKQSMGGNG